MRSFDVRVVAALVCAWCAAAAASKACSDIALNDDSAGVQKRLLLCQLHESARLVSELGALVTEGLEGVMSANDVRPDDDALALDKRKHEYVRFGKRKHEYLRFGKRKHEYLRFGK